MHQHGLRRQPRNDAQINRWILVAHALDHTRAVLLEVGA